MSLKYTKETSFRVDYNDLNTFIADTYGIDDFNGTLESGNDTDHRFNITEPDDLFDEEDFQAIITAKGCEYYSLGTVLEKLAMDGHIPRGIWYVEVMW